MKSFGIGTFLLLASAALAAPVDSAKDFVDLLAQGKFDAAEAKMDSTMQSALPAAKLQETWSMVQSQAGAFESQKETRLEKVQGYDVVFVTCQFKKAPLDVKVVLNPKAQVAGLFFLPVQPKSYATPPYAKQEAFREIELTIGEGSGWALPGTLTLPKGAGPFPALILVHGSGPHDQDETIGPNKPFRDLAWGLASRGVAVLRYEKRTHRYAAKIASAEGPFTANEESVDDAVAAFALLQGRPELDPGKIFVLGHSLGGMLIPRIGQKAPKAAGFVVLAGSSRPLEDIIVEQLTYISSLHPNASAEEKTQTEAMLAQVDRIRALKDSDLASKELLIGASPAYWLDLRGYRPAQVAKSLPQRMLLLQGERDYQVTMADLHLWQDALAGRSDVTFHSYPNLNHLFMAGEGKARPEEYERPGFVDEAVIQDIARWISTP